MNRNRKPTDTTRTFFRFLLSMVASGRASKNRQNKVPQPELLVRKSQQQPIRFCLGQEHHSPLIASRRTKSTPPPRVPAQTATSRKRCPPFPRVGQNFHSSRLVMNKRLNLRCSPGVVTTRLDTSADVEWGQIIRVQPRVRSWSRKHSVAFTTPAPITLLLYYGMCPHD